MLRTFTGKEKKVKQFLENEIREEKWERKIETVLVPMETIVEMRGGKKRTRQRPLYGGYVFLQMTLDGQMRDFFTDRSRLWPALVDPPVPLPPHEVDRLLGRVAEAQSDGAKIEIPFDPGDSVKVIDGPFNNFNGVVEDVFPDKMKVRVMVSIFGRKTPLELDYLQVEKDN